MTPSQPPSPPNLASKSELIAFILDRVRSRQSASLIRLGDGEGVVLNRPSREDRALGPYVTSHFGAHVNNEDLVGLADRLDLAIRRASVIGVRNDVQAADFPSDLTSMDPESLVAWARHHLPLRQEESDQLDHGSAYRLALLGRWMTRHEWPAGALLSSAWFHFELLESGFLTDLTVREGHIGLVTGRPELAPLFREAGIEVDEWPVPLRFTRRDERWSPHFPNRYEELSETLTPTFKGQIFFVGAGICGKVYCDVIADRGGIALDIGAVCDSWLGIATRPRVARSRWMRDDVPQRLLLRHQLVESLAKRPAPECGL